MRPGFIIKFLKRSIQSELKILKRSIQSTWQPSRLQDKTRVVMKADKRNCFVVMDKKEYNEKMQALLSDPNTYNKVTKPPFKRIERELNSHLLELKRQ